MLLIKKVRIFITGVVREIAAVGIGGVAIDSDMKKWKDVRQNIMRSKWTTGSELTGMAMVVVLANRICGLAQSNLSMGRRPQDSELGSLKALLTLGVNRYLKSVLPLAVAFALLKGILTWLNSPIISTRVGSLRQCRYQNRLLCSQVFSMDPLT